MKRFLQSTPAKVGVFCFVGLALVGAGVWGTLGRAAPAQVLPTTEVSLQLDVGFLASDILEGRAPGTLGEQVAVQHILNRFTALGLEPWRGHPPIQPVRFPVDGAEVVTHGNVVMALDVGAPTTVVLGAHHDHLGMGQRHSKDLFKRGIHNGADDNASGVALLLALAGHFSAREQPAPVNLVFVAFAGEEDGLWGSTAFLDSGWVPAKDMVAYINFDMVGRLDPTSPIVAVEGGQEFPPWLPLLERIPHAAFQVRTADPIDVKGSDHACFWARGVPVMAFTTGVSEDYHRASDDVDKVNFPGMLAIHAYVVKVVEALPLAASAQDAGAVNTP